MNTKEKRQIAAGAARSQLRKMGLPLTLEHANAVLDDMSIEEPSLIASEWYINASDAQWRLFEREWRDGA